MIKSLKSFKSFKFVVFINSCSSTFRLCFLINRTAETSQYQHIAINQTSNLKNESKIEMQSFKQKYLVDVDVIYINLNIRVETTLTKTKKYKSIKSIKSLIKSFKSIKLIKSFNFNFSINCFNSKSRFCFSINQIAKTLYIAFDKIMNFTSSKSIKSIKLIKSFISSSLTNNICSTFWFSLSANHDLITSQILIAISSFF